MQIALKPAMKRALPLAVAAMSLLPLAANTTKNETKVQKPIVPEYLQADKYEKKGDERIKAGLTQEKAYEDEATKAKFDRANLNDDYKISKEEATIYNWGGKNVWPNYWSIQQSGLVLWSRNNAGGPEYCIYPGQKYSQLKPLFKQQQLFKEADRNSNQVLSPTECLRQVKVLELKNIDERMADVNSKIKKAEKHLASPSVDHGRSGFAAFWIFAGVVAMLGGGAGGYAGDRRENAFGCLTMLAGLAAAGIAYGLMANSDNNKYENRWNSVKEDNLKKKEVLLEEQAKVKQDISFLDAQLEYEYSQMHK